MTDNPCAIGLDIGGTYTKIGLVSAAGKILSHAEFENSQFQSPEGYFSQIFDELSKLSQVAYEQLYSLRGIGASVCGYFDKTWKVPEYINFHLLEGFPLYQRLSDLYKLPVVLDNDMNCCALGEYLFGNGQGVERLMVVTIGTGVAMSVILEDQVMRFAGGTVGNPGHIILEPDGPLCPAGCRGCAESLASSGPIVRRAKAAAMNASGHSILKEMIDANTNITPKDIFLAAESGDEIAKQVWEETGKILGRAIASWATIFFPEVIVIGGGVAQAGHWLFDTIEPEMHRVGEPFFMNKVREFRMSTLGNKIAMMGAAAMCLFPKYAPLNR